MRRDTNGGGDHQKRGNEDETKKSYWNNNNRSLQYMATMLFMGGSEVWWEFLVLHKIIRAGLGH